MIEEKIKKELDNYIGFDSNLIFDSTDYLVVFGGALRDIVSGDVDNINDIDILCMRDSRKIAIKVLMENGYIQKDIMGNGVNELYKEMKCIFHPYTYYKGGKFIQFIEPATNNSEWGGKSKFIKSFFNLLKNVDLTSSGLFYDGNKLYESLEYSYISCLCKVYNISENSLMYNINRTRKRVSKLDKSGWCDSNNNLLFNRLRKIYKINGIKLPTIEDYIKYKFRVDYSPKIQKVKIDNYSSKWLL